MTIERGTTQEITITVKGWDLTGSDIYVTFKQGKYMLTKRSMESVTYANRATKIVLILSQSDTLIFESRKSGLIQVRWIDASGDAKKTKTAEFDVDDLLYEAVLVKDDDGDA